MANKFDETPLDKATKRLANILKGMDWYSNVNWKTVSICYFQSLNCLLYIYLELYTLFRSLHVHVHVCKFLLDRAVQLGQDLQKIPFKDRSWLGYKTRSSKFEI